MLKTPFCTCMIVLLCFNSIYNMNPGLVFVIKPHLLNDLRNSFIPPVLEKILAKVTNIPDQNVNNDIFQIKDLKFQVSEIYPKKFKVAPSGSGTFFIGVSDLTIKGSFTIKINYMINSFTRVFNFTIPVDKITLGCHFKNMSENDLIPKIMLSLVNFEFDNNALILEMFAIDLSDYAVNIAFEQVKPTIISYLKTQIGETIENDVNNLANDFLVENYPSEFMFLEEIGIKSRFVKKPFLTAQTLELFFEGTCFKKFNEIVNFTPPVPLEYKAEDTQVISLIASEYSIKTLLHAYVGEQIQTTEGLRLLLNIINVDESLSFEDGYINLQNINLMITKFDENSALQIDTTITTKVMLSTFLNENKKLILKITLKDTQLINTEIYDDSILNYLGIVLGTVAEKVLYFLNEFDIEIPDLELPLGIKLANADLKIKKGFLKLNPIFDLTAVRANFVSMLNQYLNQVILI